MSERSHSRALRAGNMECARCDQLHQSSYHGVIKDTYAFTTVEAITQASEN